MPVRTPLLCDASVAPSLARSWRRAVLDLRYGERRRVFPPVLWVGEPAGPSASFPVPPRGRHAVRLDGALRADVVAAMIDRSAPTTESTTEPPSIWLARSGALGDHDEDTAWLAAARTAYGEAGFELAMAVVTHDGWYDPATGAARTWRRLRRRR